MNEIAFRTGTGLVVPGVTADQMREVDRVAIEETGPNLFQMMENAGRSLALTVIDQAGPDWATVPIVVLAGTGGNGGGGICAARHLANHGADVTLVISDPAGLGPVPSAQLGVFRATRGRIGGADALATIDPALVVDAVIGYGLRSAPTGVVAEMVRWMEGQPAPVLSLDVPSGIDPTAGEAPGVHVEPDLTLTLGLPKIGLAVARAGEIWLADLGIPDDVYRRVGVEVPPAVFGSHYRERLWPV